MATVNNPNNLLIHFLQPNFWDCDFGFICTMAHSHAFMCGHAHSIWAHLTFAYPVSLAAHVLSHSDSSVLLSRASLEQCHGLIAATALCIFFYTSLGLS
jgi:hypothetical protein